MRLRAGSESATRLVEPSIARYTASMAVLEARGEKRAPRGSEARRHTNLEFFFIEEVSVEEVSVFRNFSSNQATRRLEYQGAGSNPTAVVRTSQASHVRRLDVDVPTRRKSLSLLLSRAAHARAWRRGLRSRSASLRVRPSAPMVAGYIIDYVTSLRRRGAGVPPQDPNKEMPHNFVLCHVLPPLTKWAFWLTNVPYWYLCWVVVSAELASHFGEGSSPPLWLECLRPLCASSAVHGSCVFVIAAASTAFHGFQLELDKSVKETSMRCGCLVGCAMGFKGFTMGDAVRKGSKTKSLSPDTVMIPKPSHSRIAFINRLLLCDVLCANAYVFFLVTCASVVDVARASVVPVGCMFIAAQAKRKKWYNAYVLFHGLWHLGSARAIYVALAGLGSE